MSEDHGTVVTGGTAPGPEEPASGGPVPEESGPGAVRVTDPVERATSTGLLLAGIALLWLVAMLWSARVTITGRQEAEMEVTSTAYALPGAISASLVAGAAVALAMLALLGRRRSVSATARLAIAAGTGLALGLLAALSVVTINTEGWLYAVVGGTIAAAATIGGAVAGFRVPRIVTAVCWGAVTVFVVNFLLSLFQAPLLDLFGAGDTQQSQASAVGWFATSASALSGATAGLTGYLSLRRARRRTESADVPWPFYALAGAGPGLLLVVAEGLARTAGARVLDLAGRISELELAAQGMLNGSRLNNALIVLFVGAVIAIVAVGRTMGPAPDDD
jgi:hypothetical protein